MPWFNKSGEFKAGDKEDLGDIEFKPEEFKKELSTEFDTKFGEFQSKSMESFKPIIEFAETLKREREEKAEAIRTAAAKKKDEESEVSDDDFMIDPSAAVDKKLSKTNEAIQVLAARQIKQDALSEKEYYYGEIKNKVDQMIAQQPMSSRLNPTAIENCYKLVLFDHQQDIADGKLKKRNTSLIFEGGSTGGHGGKDAKENQETLDGEEKMIASKMGISEKDWIASKREMNYV